MRKNCTDVLKAELHTWYTSEEKQTSTLFCSLFSCVFLWLLLLSLIDGDAEAGLLHGAFLRPERDLQIRHYTTSHF